MAKDEQKLEKLKKEYEALKKKHDIPDFKDLNEDFNIEKIAESETEILIREVRKFMGDKMMNYMRFIENLLNPVNVPMFIFSIVKLLNAEEKKELSEIYKEIMKKEIQFIELDLEFNEKKEAEFVKNAYEFWQRIKKDMLKIMDKINKKWDNKFESNSKGYFG
jgi:large-conductance mechanosensitive channel